MAAGDLPLLEPLCFKSSAETATSHKNDDVNLFSVPCLLCTEVFSVSNGTEILAKHLWIEHKLIIDDIQFITDISRYFQHWKCRLEDEVHLEDICSINENSQGVYFILSDSLPEDKELRLMVQQQKLLEVLDQQQNERDNDENFCRSCLFCTRNFNGSRSKLFSHMAEFHNFDIGDVNNLVYTYHLLRLLEEKLHNLQCLYCEKTFKDGPVLKEHMRKKRHKRLRINSPTYRWFFVSNYLGEKDCDVIADNDEDDEENADEEDHDEETLSMHEDEWSDWVETEGSDAVCLFCHQTATTTELLLQHLKSTHGFNLQQLITDHKLSFYQQVKLINFMRRQLHYNTCTYCDEKYENFEALSQHLTSTEHSSQLPPVMSWNQPEYYFPTYENDSLLCSLMDVDEEAQDAEVPNEMLQVTAEDLPEIISNIALEQPEISADKHLGSVDAS